MLFEPGTKVRIKAGAVAVVYRLIDQTTPGYYPDSRIEVSANEITEEFDAIVMVVNHREDKRNPDNTTIVVDVATGEKHIFTDSALRAHIEERDG